MLQDRQQTHDIHLHLLSFLDLKQSVNDIVKFYQD